MKGLNENYFIQGIIGVYMGGILLFFFTFNICKSKIIYICWRYIIYIYFFPDINALLLSLGLVTVLIPTGSVASYSCNGEQNMNTVPDFSDRHAYYLCLNGRAEKFYCPPGFKFDSRKPACVPKRVNSWNW